MEVCRFNVFMLLRDEACGYLNFDSSVVVCDTERLVLKVYEPVLSGNLKNSSERRARKVIEGIQTTDTFVRRLIQEKGVISQT